MLTIENSLVLAIDFQTRLMPSMHDYEELARKTAIFIKGCRILDVPIIATQQYTKGLGESVPEIKEAFASFSHIEKGSFSVMGDPACVDALAKIGRKNIVLCGVEAHVCILQSALDMLEAGYEVFLATDAISSRKERDEEPAVKRMIRSGVVPTTVESTLFELLDNDSKSDTFKTISKLIR